MRNVFLFIKRNALLFLFLLLEIVSLFMLFSYNSFHNSLFGMMSSELSGKINERVDNVNQYFNLREENEQLRAQNSRLLSLLPSGNIQADTSSKKVTSNVLVDSTANFRQFIYMPARVLSSSVFLQQNYMMLHRGSLQGVQTNMAVIGPEGIIGTVIGVSNNMSTVMTLLHRQSKVIAVLKKGSGLGEISWDGKDPMYLTLKKVPKTIAVAQGDTIVTSPYSDRFPPGYPIGIVSKVENDQQTNTFILTVKTATDFNNVRHAYVVRNLLQEEIDALNKTQIKE